MSIVGLIAGCGSGGSEAEVSAQTEDALPSDLTVRFVTAGEQAGWVAGVGGDQREVRLWRLTPDGGAAQVAELPELVSMDSAGIETQVAVAGLRCIEGDPAEGCGASRAEVLLITDTGEISSVTLYDDDTNLDNGDGLAIAGTTRDSLWISTERGLFEVSAQGAVVRELPDATGGECVIDDTLYRVVSAEPSAGPIEGSSPPVTTIGPTQQATDRQTIEIQRLDGDTFTPVPGGGQELDGDAYPNLSCTGSAWEAGRANGVLTDRWTPTEGWHATRGMPAPRGAPAAATAGLSTGQEAFALSPEGAVLERGPDGTFSAAGIRLPDLSEPEQIPASLIADRSPSMVVACTSRSTSQTDTETVCQSVAAG